MSVLPLFTFGIMPDYPSPEASREEEKTSRKRKRRQRSRRLRFRLVRRRPLWIALDTEFFHLGDQRIAMNAEQTSGLRIVAARLHQCLPDGPRFQLIQGQRRQLIGSGAGQLLKQEAIQVA